MADSRGRPTTRERNARTAPKRGFWTVPEVVTAISVSNDVVYGWVRSGELPATPVGNRWIIPDRAFKALSGRLEAEAEAEAAKKRQILAPSLWLANRRRQQRLQKASGGLQTDGRRGGRRNG